MKSGLLCTCINSKHERVTLFLIKVTVPVVCGSNDKRILKKFGNLPTEVICKFDFRLDASRNPSRYWQEILCDIDIDNQGDGRFFITNYSLLGNQPYFYKFSANHCLF